MKGVLAPLPLPGAPLSHRISLGDCQVSLYFSSSLFQQASKTTCAAHSVVVSATGADSCSRLHVCAAERRVYAQHLSRQTCWCSVHKLLGGTPASSGAASRRLASPEAPVPVGSQLGLVRPVPLHACRRVVAA